MNFPEYIDEYRDDQALMLKNCLPLINQMFDEVEDYSSFLKGKVVCLLGISVDDKKWWRNFALMKGAKIAYHKYDEKADIIVIGSNIAYYHLHQIFNRQQTKDSFTVINVRLLEWNITNEHRRAVEQYILQEKEKKDKSMGLSYEVCTEDDLQEYKWVRDPNKELSLYSDIFYCAGKLNVYLLDSENKKIAFCERSSKDVLFEKIEKKNGRIRKDKLGNVTCVIAGDDISKGLLAKLPHDVKFIDFSLFDRWIELVAPVKPIDYVACSISDSLKIKYLENLDTLSLYDDVFELCGVLNVYNNISYRITHIEKEYSHNSVEKLIKAKGGYLSEKGKCTSCMVIGDAIPQSALPKILKCSKCVRFTDFIKWLNYARPAYEEVRRFRQQYNSSYDSKLRPYQQNSKNSIFEKWKYNHNVLLQMPTGAGKTILFTSLINDLLDVKGTKILIIAHRNELIEQIGQSLNKYGIEHGLVTSGRAKKLDRNVQVASIQTITHKSNISLLEDMKLDFIIVDECHHSLAKTYTNLWSYCPRSLKLGVTATPYRLNKHSFEDLFDCMVSSKPIPSFIENGYLSDYKFFTENPKSDLAISISSIKEKSSTGDYKTATLLEKLNVPQHIKKLISAYIAYANGKKGIVYAISIEHAQSICAAYNEIDVKAEFIDSNTPKSERSSIITKFRNDEIQILVNVNIFSEGFDCPDVEFIQMARPTWSLAMYLQQVGRGLRKSSGKDKTIILDNAGMFGHFGLPSEIRDWDRYFEGDKETINDREQKELCSNERFLKQLSQNIESQMVEIESSLLYDMRTEILSGNKSQYNSSNKSIPSFISKKEPALQKNEPVKPICVQTKNTSCQPNEETKIAKKSKVALSYIQNDPINEYPSKKQETTSSEQEKNEVLSKGYESYNDCPSSNPANLSDSCSKIDSVCEKSKSYTPHGKYVEIDKPTVLSRSFFYNKKYILINISGQRKEDIITRLSKLHAEHQDKLSVEADIIIYLHNIDPTTRTKIETIVEEGHDVISIRYGYVDQFLKAIRIPSTLQNNSKVSQNKVSNNKKRNEEKDENKATIKKIITYIFAACFVIAICILAFAGLGFAVFFLPLLAGAFAKK